MMKQTLILLYGLISLSLMAQTPAESQKKRIMLYGATAHLGNGGVIENAIIILEEGKILTIESASNIRIDMSNVEYYDLIGKHVYPGFILPNTTLGLADIDAVRATRDFNEVGDFKPHVRSIIAYNTDSPVLPTIRTNGILVGQITPRGGYISGSSSIVEFDAWNYEDALYKEDDAIHLNWPQEPWVYHNHGHENSSEEHDHYEEELKLVEDYFNKAKSYAATKPKQIDIAMEAMTGLFDGTKQLFIHAYSVKQIKESVLFAEQMQIQKMVLVGADDAWRIADFIADFNIPVVLSRTHRLPLRQSEDVDIAYKSAKILSDAGVLYCLDYQGDMERMGSRNLPFTAGTTVAYGLDKEEALMSISLNTAKILGIDNRLGSLEEGKDATLFVSEGDALDMRSNSISLAFIRGKKLELTNHQEQLYNKYKAKHQKFLD